MCPCFYVLYATIPRERGERATIGVVKSNLDVEMDNLTIANGAVCPCF